MTDITFIGTGEAFSYSRGTTSYLIEGDEGSVLVDCGYRAPDRLMALNAQRGQTLADVPNALLLTHLHGDHSGGLPALLMPIWEEVNGVVGNNFLGFDRKLVIASADTELLEPLVRRRMEDHYPTFLDRMTREGPDISYMKINPSGTPFYGFNVTAAETQHSVRNFAYRFDDPKTGKSFAISGDGSFTDATRELFKGVDLLMHEGFYVDQSTSNHASIRDIVDYAIEFGVPKVSVVHVNREERQNTSGISDLIALGEKNGVKVDVPNDYDVITV